MIVFDNCWQKSKKKTMSAVSASLKIGYTSLKIRNLSPFHSAFEQTDFLRFVPPIFLTLTSQGGNQGIANAMDKKRNPSSRDSVINIASTNLHPLFSAVPLCFAGHQKHKKIPTENSAGTNDIRYKWCLILLLSFRL